MSGKEPWSPSTALTWAEMRSGWLAVKVGIVGFVWQWVYGICCFHTELQTRRKYLVTSEDRLEPACLFEWLFSAIKKNIRVFVFFSCQKRLPLIDIELLKSRIFIFIRPVVSNPLRPISCLCLDQIFQSILPKQNIFSSLDSSLAWIESFARDLHLSCSLPWQRDTPRTKFEKLTCRPKANHWDISKHQDVSIVSQKNNQLFAYDCSSSKSEKTFRSSSCELRCSRCIAMKTRKDNETNKPNKNKNKNKHNLFLQNKTKNQNQNQNQKQRGGGTWGSRCEYILTNMSALTCECVCFSFDANHGWWARTLWHSWWWWLWW